MFAASQLANMHVRIIFWPVKKRKERASDRREGETNVTIVLVTGF
jgi:hypothetical protein